MSIKGQIKLNIGAQNQQAGSDSLYIAFNKIQNNFNTLFNQASTYDTFISNPGIQAIANSNTHSVTFTNTGVLSLNPGTGITLSGSNGNVTVSVSGNVSGELVAGVTSVGVKSNTLAVSNSPVVGAGNITLELPEQNAFAAGTYTAATVTVDQQGRVTNIANTISSGTVTSVAMTAVDGIAIIGGPIVSNGTFEITNTGVLSLTAGPGIVLSSATGNVTISAGLDHEVGTVTRVGLVSNTLFVTGDTISTAGDLNIELPMDANFPGNANISANLVVMGNANFAGTASLGNVSKVKMLGGTNGYVLSTDGTGNLTWVAQTGGVPGSVVATGANTQVQFNDGGLIGANANLTFNKTSGTLFATVHAGSGANLTNIPGANITGNISNANITTNLNVGNVLSVNGLANITGVANVYGTLNVTSSITAATAANNVSNTQVATTAFVNNVITNTNAGKANLASPIFTGVPQAPTASQSSPPSTQIATTAYVNTYVTTTMASTIASDATKANIASPNFTGTPTANTAPSGTNTRQLATTEYVYNALSSIPTVPRGTIVMWSGSVASIPAGYALCNGQTGTPDLRDRFVIGAGGSYAVNATGGSRDAVLVSHTHTASVTDPGHGHTYLTKGATNSGMDQWAGISGRLGQVSTSTATTGITVSNSTEGVSATNANLPPYFALCYIMSTGVPGTAPSGTDLTPYALKDSPALTGTPTAPTVTAGDSTTKIATTAFVQAAVSATNPNLTGYALLASPTFTGNPSAPTPGTTDKSTKLATTEYVKNNLVGYGSLLRAYAATVQTVAAQSLGGGTTKKFAYDTVTYDTDNAWDATNKRYFPKIAGYYKITARISYTASGTAGFTTGIELLKSGVVASRSWYLINYTSGYNDTMELTDIIQLNGTSDVVEVYWGTNSSTLTAPAGAGTSCLFLAEFIRPL